MALRPDEITEILERELSGYTATIDIQNVGTVLKNGDAIATPMPRVRCCHGDT